MSRKRTVTVYPEHEKLHKVKELSQSLGEFLDWLESNGLTICGLVHSRYEPDRRTVEQWLADFYGIDLVLIDQEKEHMLDELRDRINRTKGTP